MRKPLEQYLSGVPLELVPMAGPGPFFEGRSSEVDALLFAKGFRKVVDEFLVIVVTSEMTVPAGTLDFKGSDLRVDFENRYVERTATQIEHRDRLLFLLV